MREKIRCQCGFLARKKDSWYYSYVSKISKQKYMSPAAPSKATLLELKKSAKQHLQNTYQWKRSRDPIVLVSLEDVTSREFVVE